MSLTTILQYSAVTTLLLCYIVHVCLCAWPSLKHLTLWEIYVQDDLEAWPQSSRKLLRKCLAGSGKLIKLCMKFQDYFVYRSKFLMSPSDKFREDGTGHTKCRLRIKTWCSLLAGQPQP